MKLFLNAFGFYNIRTREAGLSRKIYFHAILGYYIFCVYKVYFWTLENNRPNTFNRPLPLRLLLNAVAVIIWITVPLLNLITFAFYIDRDYFSAKILGLVRDFEVSSVRSMDAHSLISPFVDFLINLYIAATIVMSLYLGVRWPGAQFSDYFCFAFLESMTFIPGVYLFRILIKLLRLHYVISNEIHVKINELRLLHADCVKDRMRNSRKIVRDLINQQKRIMALIFHKLDDDLGYSILLLVLFISMCMIFDFSCWAVRMNVEFQVCAVIKACIRCLYLVALFASGEYTSFTVSRRNKESKKRRLK